MGPHWRQICQLLNSHHCCKLAGCLEQAAGGKGSLFEVAASRGILSCGTFIMFKDF
jgi:hypothetical protein